MRNEQMLKLDKLQKGDRVAIVSPSFAAPGKWPHVYQLGLQRLKEVFGLEPVEFPATKKVGASKEERAQDLICAFENTEIKAVIASLGGDDQVTYIKNLPKEPFIQHPKPFFGYSDNTHFANFLWLNSIPSFYGGSLFVQFAEQGEMNPFTVKYLQHALFDEGEFELEASKEFTDIGLDWNDPANLKKRRCYEPNQGWIWDGRESVEGLSWGGCIESIDELLRHNIRIPTLQDFENIILLTETSEEIPPADYVRRVYRAFGERGILERLKGLLVGRPKTWERDKPYSPEERTAYRQRQQEMVMEIVRAYNPSMPIIQNVDFGHTDPQIAMPYGAKLRIDSRNQKIFATF